MTQFKILLEKNYCYDIYFLLITAGKYIFYVIRMRKKAPLSILTNLRKEKYE